MPIQELFTLVDTLLGKKDDHRLKSLLTKQNFHTIARVIDHLSHGKRKTFAILPPEIQAEVALVLGDRSKKLILMRLSDHTLARFLHFNDEDDAADILQFVDAEKRQHVLSYLKEEKRTKIEKLLNFNPESAGGLMDLNFIIVKPEFTLRDVAEKVRHHMELHKQAPLVIVTDLDGKAIGYLPYRTLILSQPAQTVEHLMQDLPTVSHKMDQEKVLRAASREKGDVMGVVDEHGKLLGIVHLRDLLKVAQMEATEDVYKFAGVSTDEQLLDSPWVAVRLRFHWLIINLATALLAASVVIIFGGAIRKAPILAALMPIIAGMGGNAATQTLAVVVRGMAIDGTARRAARRILWKEALAGLCNGLINGIILAIVVVAYYGAPAYSIALIALASMVLNLVVAGIFGAVVPMIMKAMKVDPAIASTVFVTTATDVFGFLALLGLATLILR